MDHLQTEARNPASANLDELTPLQLVQLMNAEDARVIPAVAAQAAASARAIEIIAERLRDGGRLVYAGAGTSGRLGVLDATECPPTFNAPLGQVVGLIAGGPAALTQAVEGAEDRPELAEADLEALHFSAKDVLVGIATSGRTPYVLGAVAYARRLGAYTIGFSCNVDSEVARAADLAITPVVGPEILSGSTRLKAGTATKLVLNMLTTGAMVRLGKTFGNLMVDLRATNSKLRARTNRIVRQLTGLSVDEADRLLVECDGELKTALVSQLTHLSPADSRLRLSASAGQVRPALQLAHAATSPRETYADLYLGFDGGGTHTRALLVRAAAGGWSLLGSGQAGPSNLRAVGADLALRHLHEAVRAAFDQAGLPCAPVAAACLGLAGAGRPEDQAVIRDWASRVYLAEHVNVTTDADLLLAAGTADGWGLALIAGTGSMAFGRHADGRTARAGGWGHLLGDEGSGYALVVSGLRAVACAADGRGPATRLTEALLSGMGVSAPAGLIAEVYGGDWDRARLAGLASVVLETAARGDTVASDLVSRAARQLAETAAAVVRALTFVEQPLPVALAGGVLVSSEMYRAKVLEAFADVGIHTARVTVVADPAEGAVLLAMKRPINV